jgi:very-short-patch-repair endonuclease
MKQSTHILRDRGRQLRRNQTDAERELWARRRARQLSGFKFRRQYPIGPFITDFCCFEQRLVVELDGGQHAAQRKADRRRSDVLGRHGYRLLRFWDNEVMQNIDGVLQRIVEVLDLEPSPIPSPTGRGLKRRSEKSDNPKSKTCTELCRSIQNLKFQGRAGL